VAAKEPDRPAALAKRRDRLRELRARSDVDRAAVGVRAYRKNKAERREDND
jgi:hypothetical protein